MKLPQLISSGFLGLLSVVAMWVGTKIDKLADNVADLNTKMAVVIHQQTETDRKVEGHEGRLRYLEVKKR